MSKTYYNSKIDWWVPAVVVFSVAICFIGPMIDGKDYVIAILMGSVFLILEIATFASVKYQICEGRLGVRNIFYKWEWFPIEKISEVKKSCGLLAASALSSKRISIKFFDKKILKSSMPLEISPKDQDIFIAQLKEINPQIELK